MWYKRACRDVRKGTSGVYKRRALQWTGCRAVLCWMRLISYRVLLVLPAQFRVGGETHRGVGSKCRRPIAKNRVASHTKYGVEQRCKSPVTHAGRVQTGTQCPCLDATLSRRILSGSTPRSKSSHSFVMCSLLGGMLLGRQPGLKDETTHQMICNIMYKI